jgi:cyclopropane fatty-acyl-phospholipid synthase-like methyltransferase
VVSSIAPRDIRGTVERPPSVPLRAEDFTCIARQGFGDGRNAYAHSAAWFGERVYVGTTRDNLCLVAARNPMTTKAWPVQCTQPPNPHELRAQIWSYDVASRTWDCVQRSPMIEVDGREVMRDIGYRGMTVFKGASDPQPVLYCATWSATGTRLMRSVDGRTFEVVGRAGLVHPDVVCLRALQPFKDRLYTSPIGRPKRNPNEASRPNEAVLPVVLESADPASGDWRIVSEPGFGNPHNVGVFELQAFDDHLYAVTINYVNGFELWKTDAEGRPPYRWTNVLSSGAYRGRHNEGGASLYPFRGALYVGTGISGGGYNRFYNIGPAAAELLRVFPDDSWDLVVGIPRATPDGLKVPLSGLGPGFDNFCNGYTWRMGEHDGCLYVSTYNWAVFLPYLTFANAPETVVKFVEERGADALAAELGGAELWRTQDGHRWHPVVRDGFGTPFNFGFRTLVSTPHGLFAGSANPFGPMVAVKTDEGWTYQPNPRGGCEVWLGRASEEPPIAAGPIRLQRSPRAALRPLYRRCEREVYAYLADDYYESSNFDHIGYWADGARTARQACETLMSKLAAPIDRVDGRILEVDCGRGGTTRDLVDRFGAARVTAIGHRDPRWHRLERQYPGLTLLHMEASDLEFADRSFRYVVSVERPGFLADRRAFLREAWRVLETGGRLLLADALYVKSGEIVDWSRSRRNYLPDVSAYAALLQGSGFTDVRTVDVTEQTAVPYARDAERFYLARYRSGAIDSETFNWVMSFVARKLLFLNAYVLIDAVKA